MINVIITAPRGAMDSLIVQECAKHPEINVVACVGTPGAEYIGKDAGSVAGCGGEIGALIYDSIEAEVTDENGNPATLIDLCDVVVDYSRIELSMEVLEACVKHGKALLCGTTGFSEEQLAGFAEAAKQIPVMQTANTSYVVTVMRKLLTEAAELLGDKAGIEIIEAHSDTKLDAPSGTAIEMANAMVASSSKTSADITFHSVRAGNTPSSHHVLFGCRGEMMQITHDAYDWRCYAIGACDGVVFLADKLAQGAGGTGKVYTMDDVIA